MQIFRALLSAALHGCALTCRGGCHKPCFDHAAIGPNGNITAEQQSRQLGKRVILHLAKDCCVCVFTCWPEQIALLR